LFLASLFYYDYSAYIIFIENLLNPRESTRKITLEKDDEEYIEGGDNTKIYKDYINLKVYEIKDTINEYYRIVNQRSSITYYKNNYLIPDDFKILDDGFSEVTINDWLNENPTNYTVDKLKPIKYYDKKTGGTEIGFIAHELQQVYPYLVTGNKDDAKYQAINYNGLIGILVHEIQQLKAEVSTLKGP
jgi:hypothetical protein